MTNAELPTPTSPPEPLPQKSVLLLDDDQELCDVLAKVLSSHGYDVKVVNRGVEGIREIISAEFSAIVCDLKMPGMRGDIFYTAVERVKPHLCSRFIFITGEDDQSEAVLVIRALGCEILFKPLDTAQLLQKVAHAATRAILDHPVGL